MPAALTEAYCTAPGQDRHQPEAQLCRLTVSCPSFVGMDGQASSIDFVFFAHRPSGTISKKSVAMLGRHHYIAIEISSRQEPSRGLTPVNRNC